MIQKLTGGTGYIIDVVQFHAAVRDSLEDYQWMLRAFCNPDARELLDERLFNTAVTHVP